MLYHKVYETAHLFVSHVAMAVVYIASWRGLAAAGNSSTEKRAFFIKRVFALDATKIVVGHLHGGPCMGPGGSVLQYWPVKVTGLVCFQKSAPH